MSYFKVFAFTGLVVAATVSHAFSSDLSVRGERHAHVLCPVPCDLLEPPRCRMLWWPIDVCSPHFKPCEPRRKPCNGPKPWEIAVK